METCSYLKPSHCVKSIRIRSYSDSHFSAFGLNSIQSECGKMRTRITPNMDTFYAVPDAVKILKKIMLLPIELSKIC